jgi:hypothetical protein
MPSSNFSAPVGPLVDYIPYLTELELGGNQFYGELPQIHVEYPGQMVWLGLNNNKFHGERGFGQKSMIF